MGTFRPRISNSRRRATHPLRLALPLWLTLCLVLVCGSEGRPGTAGGTESPTSARTLKSWAYVIPASFYATDVESRLKAHDVLCLGVYRLDQEGRLYARPGLKADHRRLLGRVRVGKNLYPLISLRHARAGAAMLARPAARARAVRELRALAQKENYDGIHIDFEFLRAKHTADFALFLAELRRSLPREAVVSLAAFPPLHGRPEDSAFWDMRVLGPHFDQVVYMTYDYHLKDPGPVTDLDWARRNIQAALEHIEADRVWLGVPGYGYEWSTAGGRPRVLSEAAGRALCRRFACTRHESGTLRVAYSNRVAFFADLHSRERMASLARVLGLRGTALWRLGFEEFPPNRPTAPK